MQETVYRVIEIVCAVVATAPIGTNLGLVHLLWMLVSGRLLETRGAVIPGLSATGLSDPAVRRAWAALGQGDWTSAELLAQWRQQVEQRSEWRVHEHAGYRPVAVDVTGFWRPRLRGCATTHYHGPAGKALPAIPLGIIARVGSVGSQRLGVPLAFVRAPADDPRPVAHTDALVRAAVQAATGQDVPVFDAGFELRQLQQAGATRYLVRAAKNVTARRVALPAYAGHGRPYARGELVRPLARTYQGRVVAATPPDRVTRWQEGDAVIRAEHWDTLVLPNTPVAGAVPFHLVVLHDPRWTDPLVLATTLDVAARVLRDLYLDRWPIEQLPLAAKQMLGAARAFVSADETCQRLPELALLAGSILSILAATLPPVPTGSWDRRPRPTPGRLRRLLNRGLFPTSFPLPQRLRQKASVTAHLPTGFWGQRRRPTPATHASGTSPQPSPAAAVA
ncbi:MAG TPA: hypothetical protein VFV65_01820 [Gemmatimonadales bacterium]|nr:hypothetical protein [Gemmatimonadales bacterium]